MASIIVPQLYQKLRVLKFINGFGLGIFSSSAIGYMSVVLTGKWYLLLWPVLMSAVGGGIALVSGIWWWKLSRAAGKYKERLAGFSGVNEKSDQQDR